MPDTITTYTTFVAATGAKSSEVNNNFSNHRGTLVPIHPTAETSTSLTHSLGQGDARWSESFIRSINFGDTTGSWKIADDTTAGGDITISKGGTEITRINEAGPNIVFGAGIGLFLTTPGAARLTVTCASITTIGRPVEIRMVPNGNTLGASLSISNTAVGSVIVQFHIMRDAATLCSWQFNATAADTLGIPPTAFYWMDTSVTAGGHTYCLVTGQNSGQVGVQHSKLMLHEIF